MWAFLLLAIYLQSGSSAWATDFAVRCLKNYQKLERHVCGQCHLNVLELLKQFPPGTNLQDTQVLYLKPPWVRRIKTIPKNEGWIFHVVLQREGKILDPDFSLTSAKETKQYLREMYKIDELPNNDFEIIVIPAEDYLAEMGKVDAKRRTVDHDYYLNREGYARYPKVHATEVVAGKTIPQPLPNFSENREMLSLIEESRTIEWRDEDWVVRLVDGRITSSYRGQERWDPERVQRFFTEIERRSEFQERFRRALHHYWSMGGRRPKPTAP
jgi:hypothetical protein